MPIDKVAVRSGTTLIRRLLNAAGLQVDSADNKLKFNDYSSTSGTVRSVVTEDQVQTLTNKTVSGTLAAALLITTKAVLAVESGSRFFLDLAAGFVVTLPAVAIGLEYDFIVKTAPTVGAYTIVCPAAAALFKGHVLTNDVNSATDSDFDTTAVATLTLVLNKAVAGDRIKVTCDGVNWHYRAECSVFDAITGT